MMRNAIGRFLVVNMMMLTSMSLGCGGLSPEAEPDTAALQPQATPPAQASLIADSGAVVIPPLKLPPAPKDTIPPTQPPRLLEQDTRLTALQAATDSTVAPCKGDTIPCPQPPIRIETLSAVDAMDSATAAETQQASAKETVKDTVITRQPPCPIRFCR